MHVGISVHTNIDMWIAHVTCIIDETFAKHLFSSDYTYSTILSTISFVPLSDVPSNGLYFLTYEYVKHLLTPEGER